MDIYSSDSNSPILFEVFLRTMRINPKLASVLARTVIECQARPLNNNVPIIPLQQYLLQVPTNQLVRSAFTNTKHGSRHSRNNTLINLRWHSRRYRKSLNADNCMASIPGVFASMSLIRLIISSIFDNLNHYRFSCSVIFLFPI